jgi:hypothetical protein
MSRYDNVRRTNRGFVSTTMTSRIKLAVDDGTIRTQNRVLRQGERLDQIAGELWGDSSLWWILAACSGIGWWLQCPPGTLLRVPLDVDAVKEIAQ